MLPCSSYFPFYTIHLISRFPKLWFSVSSMGRLQIKLAVQIRSEPEAVRLCPERKRQNYQGMLSQSASSRKGQSAYSQLTSDGVWSDIKEFAKHKYQFEAPDDARVGLKELQFSAIFAKRLEPVVKHSVPTCTDARKLMEAGKIRMAEINGPMHKDVANCCRYGNMDLFYHRLNQPELALQHMSRTLLLLSLALGPYHPDVAATLVNVAMMY